MRLRTWQAGLLLIVGIALGLGLPRLTSVAEAQPRAGDVLATVGGVEVTRATVEETTASQFLNLERQRYQLTEQSLEQAVRIKLVEVEAESRGISSAQLVQEEVYDQVPDLTDDEVQAFYNERRPSAPLEQVAPQIRASLKRQAQNSQYEAFLEALRDKHPVDMLFEPKRAEVASDGFPSRGPENAPITIVEFADFQCPYCYQLLDELYQVTEAYDDQILMVYRHFPLTNIHPDALVSAEASMCAEEQGRFWEMHDAMFANQSALGLLSLEQTARRIGMDGAAFDECMESRKYQAEVEEDLRVGRELGITGTPVLFINGRFMSGVKDAEAIEAVVLDELERAGVDIEKRRLEPRRFDVAADGHPAKGPADATVTIVEFADFQCPFCQQLIGTLDRVMGTYGDDVRLVYRQFPIETIHPFAQKAAEASLCAEDQGRFWEMHDAMVKDQLGLDVGALKAAARALGLDGRSFDRCLDSGTHAAEVAEDLAAGRAVGVTGTPALFINGRYLEGIQRFETLAEIIDDELERASH